MSDYLPEEVLIEILTRLPVKSILQSRCVSKTWNSLITSHTFISHHLRKSATETGDLLLLRLFKFEPFQFRGKISYALLRQDVSPPKLVKEFYCPITSCCRNSGLNIVGSFNGVVCLSDDAFTFTGRYYLWNPTINKTVFIPCANVCYYTHGAYVHSLGFGFDSKSNDYKLVRVVYLEDDDFSVDMVPPLIEIYTVRSGCWRMVENDLKYIIWDRSLSAVMNGACHWVGRSQDRMNVVIVSFDFGDEVFGEMGVPNRLVDYYPNMAVAVCNGLLLLFPFSRGSGIFAFGKEFRSVWAMKEYGVAESWTKLFNFDSKEQIERIIPAKKNGEVLFTRNGELLCYDCQTKELLVSELINSNTCLADFDGYSYVESLVLLGETDGITEDGASHVEETEDNAAANEHCSDGADINNKRTVCEKEPERTDCEKKKKKKKRKNRKKHQS